MGKRGKGCCLAWFAEQASLVEIRLPFNSISLTETALAVRYWLVVCDVSFVRHVRLTTGPWGTGGNHMRTVHHHKPTGHFLPCSTTVAATAGAGREGISGTIRNWLVKSCSGVVLASLVMCPRVVVADGGLTIGAAFAGGAAAGELIHGPRAWAFSDADGNWQSDPPGITEAQYNAAPTWGDLPNYKGGWFNVSAAANAPSVGAKGSSVTTDAQAHIGLLAASATVTYPVRVLGGGAGAYYWANGAALGGVFARDFPGPASEGATIGETSTLIDVAMDYEISSAVLDTGDGLGLNQSAFEELNWTIDVHVHPHLSSIPDPNQIVFTARLMEESARLETVGGAVPVTTFDASTPLLSAATWNGTGTHRELDSPIQGTFNFQVEVPDTWESFDLLIEPLFSNEAGANLVPEPSSILLYALGTLLVTNRRRRAGNSGRRRG